MKLIDKNETLVPPEGHEFYQINTEGAFLIARYRRVQRNGTSYVDVCLNDQGREVLRTEEIRTPKEPEPVPEPVKLNWWQRLIEGFKRGE